MKIMRRILVVVLCLSFLLPSTTESEAALLKASNLNSLAKIVRRYSMKRKGRFKVRYTGADKDLDSVFDLDGDFFDGRMSLLDKASTSSDADVLVGSFRWDNVETVSWTGDTGIITFKLLFYDTLKQMKYANRKVKKIVKKLGLKKMGNYEKVKTIYQYIAKMMTYSQTNKNSEYSLYGALKKHKGVCNAYALCFYKFCVEAGVPCKYIGGTFTSSSGRKEGHAWNIVALGDKWYNVDLTWDDDDYYGVCYYDYFLKGSKDFDAYDPKASHKMDKSYRTGAFKKKFPIATKKFNPKTMSDENDFIRIGSWS